MPVLCHALVNVNSQGPHLPQAYPGDSEKMCCQTSLYGTKIPCHKCISALRCI